MIPLPKSTQTENPLSSRLRAPSRFQDLGKTAMVGASTMGVLYIKAQMTVQWCPGVGLSTGQDGLRCTALVACFLDVIPNESVPEMFAQAGSSLDQVCSSDYSAFLVVLHARCSVLWVVPQ